MISILNWEFGDRFAALYDHVMSGVSLPVKWTHNRPPECEDVDGCVAFQRTDDGIPSSATIFINPALSLRSAELRAAHELGHLWFASRRFPRISGGSRYERAAMKLEQTLHHFVIYPCLEKRGYDLEPDRRKRLKQNLYSIRKSIVTWPTKGTVQFTNKLLQCFDEISVLGSTQQEKLLQALKDKSVALYLCLMRLLMLANRHDLTNPRDYRLAAFALVNELGLTGHLFVNH